MITLTVTARSYSVEETIQFVVNKAKAHGPSWKRAGDLTITEAPPSNGVKYVAKLKLVRQEEGTALDELRATRRG